MSGLLKNTKLVGLIVIAAALGLVVYYYWGSGTASEPVLSVSEPVASQDLLLILNNLRSIQLDASLFGDPLFTALSDFGVTIPPEPVGRRNPFAPTGAGGAL